jgi:hypothetical protein
MLWRPALLLRLPPIAANRHPCFVDSARLLDRIVVRTSGRCFAGPGRHEPAAPLRIPLICDQASRKLAAIP